MGIIKTRYDRNYFENYFYREQPHSQRNINRVKELLLHKDTGELLEIGCAEGNFLKEARRHFYVTGLDISLGAARGARGRGKIYGFNLHLVVGDAENLPFNSRYFDYGFTHDGLHHLFDPEKGISELARVSAKGVFFIEPASALVTRLAHFLGIAKRYEPSGNLIYRFKESELKMLFTKLGFNQIEFRRYLMYYPHNPPPIFSIKLAMIFFFLDNFNFFFSKLANREFEIK